MTQPRNSDTQRCARRAGCSNITGGEPECLVCPYAEECPSCEQPVGSPCRRPSGHNCAVHIARVEFADFMAVTVHRDQVVEQLGEDETRQWEQRLVVSRRGERQIQGRSRALGGQVA